MADAVLFKIDMRGTEIKRYEPLIVDGTGTFVTKGIETDRDKLWIIYGKDRTTSDLYCFDKKGNLIITYGLNEGDYGITTDGNNFYITNQGGNITVYDKKINAIKTLSSLGYVGATWDGKNIVTITDFLSSGTSDVHSYDVRGQVNVSSFTLPDDFYGIAHNHGYLAVLNDKVNLDIYDAKGNFIKQYSLDTKYTYTDVAFDGAYYWILGYLPPDG